MIGRNGRARYIISGGIISEHMTDTKVPARRGVEKQIERGLESRKKDRKAILKAALRGSDAK